MTGLFYGDAGQFAAQLTDAITIVVFCSLMTIAFFKILRPLMGIRSDEDAEISGLDMPELGAMAYPDFLEAQGAVFRRRSSGVSDTSKQAEPV